MFKGSDVRRADPPFDASRQRAAQAVPAGYPSVSNRRVSPVVLAAVALTLGFMLLIAVTRTAMSAVYPDGYVNAFVAYQTAQPGIKLATLPSDTCGAHYASFATHEEQCDMALVSDRFSRVTLTLKGGTIAKMSFMGNGVQVGDMIQQWGRPDSIVHQYGMYTLTWNAGIVAVAKAYGRSAINYGRTTW